MQKKWVYPLLLVFLAFFILSNPESAGPQARSFFGWLGDQAEAFGTFLDGVFDDTPNAGTTTSPAEPLTGGDGGGTGGTDNGGADNGGANTGGDTTGDDRGGEGERTEDGFISLPAFPVAPIGSATLSVDFSPVVI